MSPRIPSRSRASASSLGFILAVPLLVAAGGEAIAADLLSEIWGRLEAARYSPAEPALGWDGWVGAGATVLRRGGTSLRFHADVETVLGNERRAFDATQVNYHLEPSLRHQFGPWSGWLFLHHVSRHAVDRPKEEAVDWNVLGLRASARLPDMLGVPVAVMLSAGHTTQVSLPQYGWELIARLDADVVTRPWGSAYAAGDLRLVSVKQPSPLARDGFADYRLEAGARFRRPGREAQLFAAFERRNDVFLQAPGALNRAVLGFRIGYPGPGPY